MEKTYLGNDVFRVHSDEHLESKIFISFIAFTIRNEIYKSLKPLYFKTRLSDHRYHVRYRLMNKHKTILKELDIDEKEYIAFANEVIAPLG